MIRGRFRSTNRRGVGIAFVAVMCVLIFLAITGLAIKYFTRGATRVAEAVLAGEEATEIARSAVQEAWAGLELRANDVQDGIAAFLTQPLAPDTPPEFRFYYEPARTRDFLGTTGHFTVSGVEIRVLRQVALWSRNPLEKQVLVAAAATGTAFIPALGYTATRTVCEWREVKVVYPSPPTPFCNMTLFVLNPVHLKGYERQYREMQRIVEEKIAQAEDEAEDDAPFGADVDIPRPFEDNDNVYAYFPDLRYPPFPYNGRAERPSSYDMDPPLEQTDMDNYLISLDPQLRGPQFKLRWPENLDDIQNDPLMQQLNQDVTTASSAVSAGTSASLLDPALLATMQQNMQSLRDAREPLRKFEAYVRTSLSEYRRHFTYILEDQLPDFNAAYLAPLVHVDMDGTPSVEEPMQFYRNYRATHVFPDQQALWNHLGGGGEVFLDGIYFVDGPVDVNIRYRGKGTIIARGRLTVNGCLKADGRDDASSICTLMTFSDPTSAGSGWKSLELNASVEAGLVAHVGLIKNLHLHDVFGSVAVGMFEREVIDGKGDGTSFDWSLTHDRNLVVEDLAGGAVRTDRARVCWGPATLASRVERE